MQGMVPVIYPFIALYRCYVPPFSGKKDEHIMTCFLYMGEGVSALWN